MSGTIAYWQKPADATGSVVHTDTTDPNTSTVFSDTRSPLVNDAAKAEKQNSVYIASDGSGWVWNPATSEYIPLMPVSRPYTGEVRLFGGTTPPAGWMFAEGQSLSTTAFPELFATLGYTYGGSGANFNLPDMRGRMPLGPNGTTHTLGQTGGSETTTLTSANLPSHTHTATTLVKAGTSTNGTLVPSNGSTLTATASGVQTAANIYSAAPTGLVNLGNVTTTVDAAGTGTAATTISPFTALNYIIYTGTTSTTMSIGQSGTEWNLAGTATDAADNKTANLTRTGWIGISSAANGSPNAPIDSFGAIAAGIRKVTGSTTSALSTSDYTVVYIGGANTTVTLPPPSAALARVMFNVKNSKAAATNRVTLSGHIDNVAATTLTVPHKQARTVHCDGTTWWVI